MSIFEAGRANNHPSGHETSKPLVDATHKTVIGRLDKVNDAVKLIKEAERQQGVLRVLPIPTTGAGAEDVYDKFGLAA